MNDMSARERRMAPLGTPSDLGTGAVRDLSTSLTTLLADMFALYVKTKNFHWHMSGSHFRDYHLLLDEQGDQLFATTDAIAERVRKIGGTTLRAVGPIRRLPRVQGKETEGVGPLGRLADVCGGHNKRVAWVCATRDFFDARG